MNNLQNTINDIYHTVKKIKKGKNAAYIPELAKVNPNIYGISICMVDGTIYSVGDSDVEVAIESVSKVFTLFLAIKKHGIDKIKQKIGSSGSFLPFNSVVGAELSKGHTLNPFVNAGAMATASLITDKNKEASWNKIKDNLNEFAGRKLSFSKKVYMSEMKTNHHNKSLAYLLKSYDRFYGDIEDTIDVYTRQCSILVSSKDMSVMAATFANNGINPLTNKKIVDKKYIIYILGQIICNGLYEYSDSWMIDVGLPAKSGVGGVIMAVVPGIMGISVVSPPLDKNGNSVRGIKTFEKLSKKLNLNILSN